jgi:hypothetical protein
MGASPNEEKPLWEEIHVKQGSRTLTGPARIAALFRMACGNPPPELEFVANSRRLLDPMSIRWTDFPINDALSVLHGE